MKSKTRTVVYSGAFLALGILFQSIRIFFPALAAISVGPFNLQTLIIGSLVNLTIILASWYVNIWAGVAVSIATPLYALLQGHLPLPQMFVVVAIGNSLLALLVWLFNEDRFGKAGVYVGIGIGVIVKFLTQWALVTWVVAPFFAPNEKVAAALGVGFSWVQLVTGVLGAILAVMIYPRLKTYRKN